MKQFLLFSSVAIFAIFLGSQITEGVLLVPYWQSLSPESFYAYYNEFGPLIGQFYTVLTITAALIPVALAVYCKRVGSRALGAALGSAFCAVLFVASFYVYFKGANELFYQAAFSDAALRQELVTWSYWHWGRVVVECLSLYFLIVALIRVQDVDNDQLDRESSVS